MTPHPDMKFAYKSLLNLLNGAKPSVSKEGFTWRLASSPAQIFTLGNGASLVGFHQAEVCDALSTSLVPPS